MNMNGLNLSLLLIRRLTRTPTPMLRSLQTHICIFKLSTFPASFAPLNARRTKNMPFNRSAAALNAR